MRSYIRFIRYPAQRAGDRKALLYMGRPHCGEARGRHSVRVAGEAVGGGEWEADLDR